MVSSAYAKFGVLYDYYKKYYGPDGPPDILVAHGTTRDFNPSISQAEIDRDIEKDPVRNRAEYLSEFRSDVEGFIDRAKVEACVGDYVELPFHQGISYQMFIDPATGVDGGDSYAAEVLHKDGLLTITDALREVRPPFSPAQVIAEVIIPLAKQYNIYKIHGDNFGGQFAQEPIRAAGMQYEVWKDHKSDLYRGMVPQINSTQMLLPRHERAINQICSLECSTQRTGKDQITHPSHGHDDLANVIAGGAAIVNSEAGLAFDHNWGNWVGDGRPETTKQETYQERLRRESEENTAWRAQMLYRKINGF